MGEKGVINCIIEQKEYNHEIKRINQNIFILNIDIKSKSNGSEFENNDDNIYLFDSIKKYFSFNLLDLDK